MAQLKKAYAKVLKASRHIPDAAEVAVAIPAWTALFEAFDALGGDRKNG